MKEGTGFRGGSIISWPSGFRKKDREDPGTIYHQEPASRTDLSSYPVRFSESP